MKPLRSGFDLGRYRFACWFTLDLREWGLGFVLSGARHDFLSDWDYWCDIQVGPITVMPRVSKYAEWKFAINGQDMGKCVVKDIKF